MNNAMQRNLLWTGREYYSLENCLVDETESGVEITSVIVGAYQNMIYRVDYTLKTTKTWETIFLKVDTQHRNQRQHLTFQANGKGNWIVNGQAEQKLDGCFDVDIPLTPFTNSLPINRLKLTHDQEQQIKVIYCDLLYNNVTAVTQKYVRLSETIYHYQNVPNDFEAKIEVDQYGFVVDYPELFVRTSAMETKY
jgi:uncharacterized protein